MKVLRFIIIFALAAVTAGCTQNNGHIGPLFGSWHLESMRCDGEPATLPAGTETYWKFQGHVMQAILSYAPDDTDTRTATWERKGNTITLEFTHGDDANAPGTGPYAAPEWMGFTSGTVFSLDIQKLDGGHLTLVYNAVEGYVYTYNFKKTW